jgi:hypothetical protein
MTDTGGADDQGTLEHAFPVILVYVGYRDAGGKEVMGTPFSGFLKCRNGNFICINRGTIDPSEVFVERTPGRESPQ